MSSLFLCRSCPETEADEDDGPVDMTREFGGGVIELDDADDSEGDNVAPLTATQVGFEL